MYCYLASMDFEDDISPMDELLEKNFPDDQYISNWIHDHSSDELEGGENYIDLEQILSQTRLNDLEFDASSTISSEPKSPQNLQDCSEHITDEEIINLPIRVLNKRLRNLPKWEIQKIRKRRRSLKNRGYASSCRQRRVAIKECLETQNQRLKMQLTETKEKLNTAVKERDTYKTKYEQLRQLLMTLRSQSNLNS